jgi:hypothetical protein
MRGLSDLHVCVCVVCCRWNCFLVYCVDDVTLVDLADGTSKTKPRLPRCLSHSCTSVFASRTSSASQFVHIQRRGIVCDVVLLLLAVLFQAEKRQWLQKYDGESRRRWCERVSLPVFCFAYRSSGRAALANLAVQPSPFPCCVLIAPCSFPDSGWARWRAVAGRCFITLHFWSDGT